MSRAVFYHAGCPICLGAEQMVADAIDHAKYEVDVVHLGLHTNRIAEAEAAGVQSVPALLLNGQVFHINFGAALSDLV
jgi:glutaredoxin